MPGRPASGSGERLDVDASTLVRGVILTPGRNGGVMSGQTGESLVPPRAAEFRSLDGLRLLGTLIAAPVAADGNAAVLVHGGGVTRDEGGFFTRLAAGLG